MKIFLERFPAETAEFFIKELTDQSCKIVGVSLYGSGEIKNDSLLLDIFNEESLSWKEQQQSHYLQPDQLNFVSKYDSVACSITSRYLYKHKLNIEDLIEHFHSAVGFWLEYIKQNDLELVLHHFTPHTPSSFALFVAAKCQKIHVLYVDLASILNRYKYLSPSISNRTLLLENTSIFSKKIQISLNIFLKQITDDKPESFPKSVREVQSEVYEKMLGHGIKNKKLNFIQKAKRVIKNKHRLNYIRTGSANKIFSTLNMNYIQYFIFLLNHKMKVKKYYKNYLKHTVKILPKKYIYFAAHAQPEASTLPSALYNRNQLNFIKNLLDNIPENVVLVFKENPTMFTTRNPFITAINWREHGFFEKLHKNNRIVLVENNFSSRELIQASMGVATINGTVGIEALAFNKPCLVNSKMWYDRFPNIFQNSNPSEVDAFTKEIFQNNSYWCEDTDLFYDLNQFALILYEDHHTESYSMDENKSIIESVIWYINNASDLNYVTDIF